MVVRRGWARGAVRFASRARPRLLGGAEEEDRGSSPRRWAPVFGESFSG